MLHSFIISDGTSKVGLLKTKNLASVLVFTFNIQSNKNTHTYTALNKCQALFLIHLSLKTFLWGSF